MKIEKHGKHTNPNELSVNINHIIKQTKCTEKTREKAKGGEGTPGGGGARVCPEVPAPEERKRETVATPWGIWRSSVR